MTFNPNIPRPTDLLSNSQGDLLANNTNLNAIFARNHIALNVATNKGKHTFIEMPASAGIPTPVPGLIAGEGTLYTKTATSITNLFYTADAGAKQYQLTRAIDASFALFATNTAYVSSPVNSNTVSGGWSFLPGGMLFQYGIVTINGSPGATAVTYPVAFASPAYMLQVTAITSSSGGDQTAAIRVSQGSNTGFNINSSSTGTVTGFNWMAVGV